jgi:predicted GTPase
LRNPDLKVVCLLGATGVGKSSLAITLGGKDDFFKISGDTKSETDRVQSQGVELMTEGGVRVPTLIIDTPGFGDTEGRDSQHLAEMVIALKAIKRVNTFIVCLNSEDVRIDENK